MSFDRKKFKEELNLPSETFCALPFVHLSTRPGGEVRCCCSATASSVGPSNDTMHGHNLGYVKDASGKPFNLNESTLLEAWNSDYMKNVRTRMMNGEFSPSCGKCYREEASGHLSKRVWETRHWVKEMDGIDNIIQHLNEDGELPPNVIYADLRFGTKCQLACAMCSGRDSSGWIPLYKKMYPTIENPNLQQTMWWEDKDKSFGSHYNWHKDNDKFWDELYDQIPNMKQLYFAGGEPLIIDEHYMLLQKVIEMGYADKIMIRYNSNAVDVPDKLFKLWSHFKKVRFHFSLDSFGEMNSYIRYPSDWNTIEENLWKFDNTADNIEVTLACAVSALNIYYMPDFILWKINQGFNKINMWPSGAGLVNNHLVYWPPQLNVRVFPKEFKKKIRKHYEEMYPVIEKHWQKATGLTDEVTYDMWRSSEYGLKRLDGLLQFMDDEDWSERMPEFREYINKMDHARNTDFGKTFPEMKELL